MARTVNGILLSDKVADLSSNAMLQKVKRLFLARKAGHTGSLDPIATGLLPICFGEATKFAKFLLEADKYYFVTAKLGIKTTTGDLEGEIVESRGVPELTADQLEQILAQFRGQSTQIPPMYSALKHQGQPLYKLARAGIEIPRDPRAIQINTLILKAFSSDQITLEIKCSKGTYVRTLVEDIGEALGCGAHVVALRRLGVGNFQASQMITLDKMLELSQAKAFQKLDRLLLPVESLAAQCPSIILSESVVFYVQRGESVRVPNVPAPGLVRLLSTSRSFIGMGEVLVDGMLVPRRLLATKAKARI